MAGKKQLPAVRVAGEGDTPSPPLSLSQAFECGSRVDELKAMYRILAAHIENENTLARDLATLTRQVREISVEIESLEAREEENSVEVGTANGAADAKWRPEAI